MKEAIIWPSGHRRRPVTVRDSAGSEMVCLYVDSTSKGHPVFRIDGEMTLPQLYRLAHLLGEVMVDRPLSAETAAGWARDERLGKLVTLGAGDDR